VTSHFDLSSRRRRVSGFHSLELSLATVVGSLGLDEVGLAMTELVSKDLKSDLYERRRECGKVDQQGLEKGKRTKGRKTYQ
jgi:hypothetical protein